MYKQKKKNIKEEDKKFIPHKKFNSASNSKIFKDYIVHAHTTLLPFLIESIPSKSRNNIKALLSNHQILVNGAPVSQFDYELLPKDVISVSPNKGINIKTKFNSSLDILYEDDELIAINKPSGLIAIADDKEKENTAYRKVMDYVRSKNPKNRIFIVHRIDKETSGVMIFSKNEILRDALQDKWNELVKKREYIAVCEGVFSKKKGTRITYLMQTKTNIMYSTKDAKNGLKAITHYEVISEKDNLSLLKVNIDTGRKNQIRVHMKDLGHIIVGDDKYGDKTTLNPFSRLGLHARVLEFDHPLKEKHFKFKADTPKVFLNYFNLKKIK